MARYLLSSNGYIKKLIKIHLNYLTIYGDKGEKNSIHPQMCTPTHQLVISRCDPKDSGINHNKRTKGP